MTALLQFVCGRPGPLLNPDPGTSQCKASRGMHWWSIRITCPSQRSLLSLSMSSILRCPVLTLTSSFVTLSFQEMPQMLLCHLWWAAFSLFVSVAVRGHTSALYRRVERIIVSYNLIFIFRLEYLLFHINWRCQLWGAGVHAPSTSNCLIFWPLQSCTNSESLTLDSMWLPTQKKTHRPIASSFFIASVSRHFCVSPKNYSLTVFCPSSREILATPLSISFSLDQLPIQKCVLHCVSEKNAPTLKRYSSKL